MSYLPFIEQGLETLRFTASTVTTLENLVQLAVKAARSDAGSLYLGDEQRGVLKKSVVIGLSEDYIAECGDVPIGEQCCGRAVMHKKPWIVTDMLTDPLFASAREASVRSGIRAAFSVPVVEAQGKVLGSLACHYREPFSPTNYEIERNHLFATLIAFALVRAESERTPTVGREAVA